MVKVLGSFSTSWQGRGFPSPKCSHPYIKFLGIKAFYMESRLVGVDMYVFRSKGGGYSGL